MQVKQTITGGQIHTFTCRGDYFRLLEANNPVTITFMREGSPDQPVEDVRDGYAEKFPSDKPISGLMIWVEADTEIHFAVRNGGNVEYEQAPTGDVTISDRAGNVSRFSASVAQISVIVLVADPNRKYLLIQNTSDSDYLRVRFDGVPTTSQGLRIAPGGHYENGPMFCPTGDVRLVAESGVVAVEGVKG